MKALFVVLLSGFIVACSSDSDSDPSPAFTEGEYDLTATATTELDSNGDTCGDGAGSMNIADGEITGSVLSTNNNLFDVTGSVTADGSITGGFARSGENLVDFEGSMSGSQGSGTWKDQLECEGTWSATLQAV